MKPAIGWNNVLHAWPAFTPSDRDKVINYLVRWYIDKTSVNLLVLLLSSAILRSGNSTETSVQSIKDHSKSKHVPASAVDWNKLRGLWFFFRIALAWDFVIKSFRCLADFLASSKIISVGLWLFKYQTHYFCLTRLFFSLVNWVCDST